MTGRVAMFEVTGVTGRVAMFEVTGVTGRQWCLKSLV